MPKGNVVDHLDAMSNKTFEQICENRNLSAHQTYTGFIYIEL